MLISKCKKNERESINKPEWLDGRDDKRDRESRGRHSYSPSSTYCIRSCANQHEACNEQRSSSSTMASAMAASGCPHQAHHLPAPQTNPQINLIAQKIRTQILKKSKRSQKIAHHDSSAVLEFELLEW